MLRRLFILPLFVLTGLWGITLIHAEREEAPQTEALILPSAEDNPKAEDPEVDTSPGQEEALPIQVIKPEHTEADLSNTPQSQHETRFFIQTLERMHLRNKMLSEVPAKDVLDKDPLHPKVVTKGIINAYVEELDPNRLFLTQKNIERFKKRFGATVHLYLYRGAMDPAVEIFKEFKKRCLERLDWAVKRLDEPFDLESEASYAPDRTKSDWEPTDAALDAVWESRVLSELVSDLLPLIAPLKDDDAVADSQDQIEEGTLSAAPPSTQDTEAEQKTQTASEDPEVKNPAEAPKDNEEPPAIAQKPKEEIKPLPLEEALPKAIESLKKRFSYWRSNIDEISFDQVQEIFLSAIAQLYDSHSSFFSADSMDNLSASLHNVLIGIGAMLMDEEGYCTVKDLIPGGPAHLDGRIGLEDKILAVAEGTEGPMIDVVGMKTPKIVKMIRGPEHSKVRLLIQAAGADRSTSKEVILERKQIELTANLAKAKLFEVPLTPKAVDTEPSAANTRKIGFIHVPSFYGDDQNKEGLSSVEDVDELITRLKALGMEGLILDLRYNGGGILQEGVALAGLFVPAGPIMQAKNTLGQTGEYTDSSPYVAWAGPTIVLGNRYSASASEIVIGALMDYRKALFVGDKRTHGKGTVQAILSTPTFPGGVRKQKSAAAKVTVQQYYRLNGESTQLKGVAADIALPSLNDLLSVGEEALSNPVPWDQIHPIKSEILVPQRSEDGRTSFKPIFDKEWNAAPVTEELIVELRVKSLQRQQTLQEFDVFKKSIQWAHEKHERKLVPLSLEKRKAQREEDTVFIKESDKALRTLISEPYPHQEILLKLAEEKEKEREALDKHLKKDSSSDKDKSKIFDIPLRESLRIMNDWIELQAASHPDLPPADEGSDPQIP